MTATDNSLIIYNSRGRSFTADDLRIIEDTSTEYFNKGRTFISQEICKKLNWKQPNGWLKDRACREVLRDLDNKKIIKLPPSKIKRTSAKSVEKQIKTAVTNLMRDELTRIAFKRIQFIQVKGTKDESLWNSVVNEYHYLGFKSFVGRSLKYLIFFDGKIIAAIGFCDPSWRLASRDIFFEDKGLSHSEIRWFGINNGRFLILPWVKVKNLASRLLSQSLKILKADWEKYYSVKPLYIETFVDPNRFFGTCYKADNWTLIGETKGYKKSGAIHSNSQVPKLIFIKLFSEK